MNVRHAASLIIAELLKGAGSLSSHLPTFSRKIGDTDKALLQELCFGTCRHYPQLQAYLDCLLDKPLRAKDSDIHATLLIGFYQLLHTRIPDHAAIGETVEVTKQLKKPWATKLVNGVLRQLQRDKTALDEKLSQNPSFVSNHPAWLEGMLKKAWGENFASICEANNSHPPFTLRLNTQQISRENYLARLESDNITATATPFSPYGITLASPCDPRDLPLFEAGMVSVQDEAAQLACDLLGAEPNDRILDACAAPGGKTGHLLEQTPSLLVTALDIEERRLTRVRENLDRLGVSAHIQQGDGTQPKQWWDGQLFDRILLDAPCSATGILRRHPDIKLLRTPEDIQRLSELQGQLLDALWTILKPGGVLLYATCSIMPRENTRVIEAFLAREPSAEHEPINTSWGIEQTCGRQLLPQQQGHDGFYYARLIKPLAT